MTTNPSSEERVAAEEAAIQQLQQQVPLVNAQRTNWGDRLLQTTRALEFLYLKANNLE